MNANPHRWAALAVAAMACPEAAMAQSISAQEAADLRAQIDALKAQVQALEKRLDGLQPPPATASATAPSPTATAPPPAAAPETRVAWKGSPQFTRDDAKFKVKGRIQFDAAYLAAPDTVNDGGKGFSNEVRRLRLGAEGALGNGFGYKLETELSDSNIELVDVFATYSSGKLLVTLGNHNQFQSLDELISDTAGSVMERAAFTDAFGFERRLGLSVQYSVGPVLAQAGIFTDSADALLNENDGPNGGDENDSYGVDGRMVFAPRLGKVQLHLAGSAHWRDFNRLSEVPQRYRQRPFVHTVNTRFLETPTIPADGESHYGLEAAAVMGSLHFAGEGHWLTVSRPGLADPTFFGAYAEVGYFLTGETRPYKDGILGTPAPRRAIGDGGPGAIQVNLRYDYLDMNDLGIVGGTQNAYLASLIWTPIEFLRFNVNYGHIDYTHAAILSNGSGDYGIDVMGVRAELDF